MKILFLQGNLFASGYYRIAFPAEQLQRQGLAEVEIVSKKDEWKNKDPKQAGWLISKMRWADVIVYELIANLIPAVTIPIVKKFGKKAVVDYDDNLFDVPKWNPAYYGLGQEFLSHWQDKDGKPMDMEANARARSGMLQACQMADLVTVTGPTLADVYRKTNPNITVLPNCIDFDRIHPCGRSTDGKVRIFWQGSQTHKEDLASIKQVFEQITEEYPNVQWVIWGPDHNDIEGLFGKIPKERFEIIEMVPFDDYYDKLNSLTIDIGICPLAYIYYNECKSNIKWLEYSALKVPAVASKISTYGAIEHGETGFLAKRHHDWMSALRRLIESPELRDKIAEKAHNKVRRDFNIEKSAHLWLDTYRKLWR
jgi:glycosyltransferase involved in cell wall biosynthesis